MEIIKEVEDAFQNPREYYNNNIKNLENNTIKKKYSVLIALLNIAPTLGEFIEYERLHKLFLNNKCLISNKTAQFYMYSSQGSFYRYLKENEKSLESFHTANRLSYELGERFLIIKSLLSISMIHGIVNDYDSSYHYAKLAMDQIEEDSDPKLLGTIFLWLGAIYGNLNDIHHAYECLLKAKNFFELLDEPDTYYNYFTITLNLGQYFLKVNDLDQALKYAEKAYYLKEKSHFFGNVERLLNLLANIYELKKEYLKSLEYYKECNRYILDRKENQSKFKLSYFNDEFIKDVTLRTKLFLKDDLLQKVEEKNNATIKENTTQSKYKLKIVEDVIEALTKGEFITYFQGKNSVKNDTVVGAEALIRWRKPDGEIIPSCEYLSYIENSPLIHEISKIVIKDSFALCQRLVESGSDDFSVSINISPYQLLNENVKWLLEKEFSLTNIQPYNIDIEITEQAYLGRGFEALEKINELKDLGINISLDDFGDGFASLSNIVHFPFDTVKIDKSLVEHISHNVKARDLFEGVVSLIKNIGLKIVAEGVETQDQINIIKATNCDLIQGFYYGKPVSSSDFFTHYKSHL